MRGDISLLQYIAGLEQREKELERELDEVRIALAHAKRTAKDKVVRATLPGGSGGAPEGEPKLPWQPYAGMGVEEAALQHLLDVGKAQRTAQIRDALIDGGIKTEAKNFNSTVFGSLRRLVDKGKVKKVGTGMLTAVQADETPSLALPT